MATETDLVHKVRRTLHDFPDRSFVTGSSTGSANTPEATVLELAAGDYVKFKSGGVTVEFDDGTDERAVTTGPADSTDNTVVIRRGMDGTSAPDHAIDTPVLIEPRFGFAQITEALHLVIDTELWPYVWIKGETTITPNFSVDHYAAPVAGMEEVVFAYQISAGFLYPIVAKLISGSVGDDSTFPNGGLIIQPRFTDTSPVYVAYRARPTLGTIVAGSSLEHLALLGAESHLMLMEESTHLAPAASAVQKGIDPGAKLRAGAVQWQRFEEARQRESISLTHEEQMRRRTYLRGA